MLDLSSHFGINVEDLFLDWFRGEYAADFAERFPGKSIALVVLDPDSVFKVHFEWKTPLENAILVAHLGDEETCTKPDGLLHNVEGKLRYVLRSGDDSVAAENDPVFFRRGDFP